MLDACRAMKETQELRSTPISIDTFDAEVAAHAVAAGAHMVNDVSGGLMDPNMHAQVCCTAVASCAHLTTYLAGCLWIACSLYRHCMQPVNLDQAWACFVSG